ncbi:MULTISPECIES: formate dehydrogenase accessory sulfurtransferase FdhD [Metallosphaera]|uniref:Sulfur carrier protein FdhD n=3 Tax=Metallosphaera TaxID=41980 RepID=A4YGC6_METS5|nr:MULTISPECIES: formate dehydrogenase accessory sulfurtransferase FdhD [Metallosphaera]ABP95478.1 formate dehydrogenase family accessory protein FdhD [Metallosphaera sedula DSM 5348]AIM27463.1 formate dehydrogenase family accessory protein FdhD [Metallosphaera sedula]AKV74334.1 formate dehydrogenase [Metallosphaera sedula]AKV76573.1 formate dehydrogenase [Metallosphaera sedula]AKV78825.1 formate dehydrogenase [Metallosphaera sedula]
MQVSKVNLVKVKDGHTEIDEDFVAVEEPLEIVVCNGGCKTFAIVMRTPGNDQELSLGFLYSEGVIDSIEDVVKVKQELNRVEVYLRDVKKLESRQIVVNSSCGICGRALLYTLDILSTNATVSRDVILSLPEKLRERQSAFNVTGGLHAAGLFTREGELQYLYEDVGRHNAVDKVVGKLLMERKLPANSSVLQVSGRLGYEIVSKAIMAGIPVISGISAPTSYAVRIADNAGATLIGFVRGKSFNVYSHPERIS